ncbi:MAG: peptide-methionine (S)-S-oxide reductase MsrA [Labilithrix sp.]|nr:peptide-methionine (S)-S-oxide reductase MsrA [Labilithrix sp.]
MKALLFFFACVALSATLALVGCRSVGSGSDVKPEHSNASARRVVGTDPGNVGKGTPLVAREGHELAAFAAGCFWGVEDNFRQVPGVIATAVGYTGGHTEDPTYEAVCSHTTGHAEAVLVEYDPKKISFDELLVVFFKNHDPTTLNRQGPDRGDQYRSAIFTFSEAQANQARAAMAREEKVIGKKIVTRVDPIGRFYRAEEYHQQYDEKTGTHSCPTPKGLPRGA